MLKVGIVQMASGPDKADNLKKAEGMIGEALEGGARLILLPELFSFLPPKIDGKAYLANSEPIHGQTMARLRRIAREKGIALVGGSIIEVQEGRLYNTSCMALPSGEIRAYRKVHLFRYGEVNETQVFSNGRRGEVCDWDGVRIGLTICYDLRFPELYRSERLLGADVICNVAAFLEKTGRAHWMTLLRARAIENQVFVLAANQAHSDNPGPKYYGNSCAVDPWGRVLARAGGGEEVLLTELDLAKVDKVRLRMPILDSLMPDARRSEEKRRIVK